MSERKRVVLPFPPSANRYWRVFRGHPVTSAEARQYKLLVARHAFDCGLRPLEGDVELELLFFRPALRGDLDNRLKVVLDTLSASKEMPNGIAYRDDAQVKRIIAEQDDDKEEPRVELWVQPYQRRR